MRKCFGRCRAPTCGAGCGCAETRRRGEHHRRTDCDELRYRGRQHARRQRTVGGRGRGAADVGRIASATGAGPRCPRRTRGTANPDLGETVRDIGGCTVGLVGWAISPNGWPTSSARWAPPCCTPAPAMTGGPGWWQLPELLAVSDPGRDNRHETERGAGTRRVVPSWTKTRSWWC